MVNLWNSVISVDSRWRRAHLGGALFLLLSAVTAWAQSPVKLPTSPLAIESAAVSHRFTIELAVTPEQKARGLMFRKSMPADHGMLFDYGAPSEIAMWMKNTYLPLDMIFIDAPGRINHIVERAVPLSKALIASGDLARAVLELNGGTVARLGLKRGDKVRHAIFGTAP